MAEEPERLTIQVPHRMFANDKRALEAAGVWFGDPVPGNPMLVNATLQFGWTVAETPFRSFFDILDEEGWRRATFNLPVDGCGGTLYAHTRYWLRLAAWEEKNRRTYFHVMDGDHIHHATVGVDLPPNATRQEKYDARALAAEQAREWLDAKFPDWRSPNAYREVLQRVD